MITVLNTENVDYLKEPMFLGKSLGIQRYDRFKYPKFFELWRKQKEYRWMPEEVSLSLDRGKYQELSSTERFIFDSNIKWQTMTDSMLSRSIHEIKSYVSNPELEICMNEWASFEDTHSYSYTYIFKNLFGDPSLFFDSVLQNEFVQGRAKQIKKSFDDLLSVNEGNIKEVIFNAILNTQITEGLSFYTSFVCSFFFGYKGLMEGNAKIISLIARDENLHVAITQNILKYWRDFADEGFQGILKANEQKIYDAYGLAVQHEKEWADYLFSNGSLLGLSADVLKGYIEWLANSRLVSLGYNKIFDQPKNPIGSWVDQYFDSSKRQVAPQESEQESYVIGKRNIEINDKEFQGFSL